MVRGCRKLIISFLTYFKYWLPDGPKGIFLGSGLSYGRRDHSPHESIVGPAGSPESWFFNWTREVNKG
jgi:hypothetical protein